MKSKNKIENFRKEKRKEYLKNPKLCKNCGSIMDFEKKKNNFCSRKCSGLFQTHKTPSNKKTKTYLCLNCKKTIAIESYRKRKYCDYVCMGEYTSKIAIINKMDDFLSGKMNDEQSRKFFRKIMIDKICLICGLSEWMGKEIPLVVDHIDGNHKNNFPSNLRYVCCNCDAQLDTYKSKNNGHGRKNRK